jgi:glycosyltransferase involved in cell wall biosynthesis
MNLLSDSHGGTDLVARKLLEKLGSRVFDGINLIVSSAHESWIKPHQVNVLWNHHNVDQPAIRNLSNSDYLKKIDCFIYVSHWQYEKYRYKFHIPEHKSVVIRNAVDELFPKEKPKKLKLIYTSTPWRGLDILLDCFEALDRNDIELEIFSSTKIYGKEFDRENADKYSDLFARAASMRNVNYRGFASNQQVREALLSAHIFAFPSTFEETSCLAVIEAGMAGLSIVTTNLGALFETCGAWARYVGYDSNRTYLTRKFTFALERAINEFWNPENQRNLKEQSNYFNRFYGWNTRRIEWENLLSQLKKLGR